MAVIAVLCVLPAACEDFDDLGEAARCRSFPSQCAGSDAGADAGTTDAGVDGGGVDAGPLPTCNMSEVPGDGVFVSVTGGNDINPGTAELPVKSVSYAIQLMAIRPMSRIIYLDQGTYTGAVVLNGGLRVRIRGGWERGTTGAWVRMCDANRSERTVLRGASPVVTINQVTGPVELEDLTVLTDPASPSASNEEGRSSIGVLVNGSALSLVNVAVFATAGGHAGSVTPMASAGSVACDGGGASDGANGPDFSGAPAAHSDGGTFGVLGFMPGNGEPGAGTGSNGNNGIPGGSGNMGMCFDGFCRCEGAIVFGMCKTPAAVSRSSESGRCGCGGVGGAGGPGGRGGGASVAVVALNGATVTASLCALEANAGGNGSSGRSNAGGAGTVGVVGTEYKCLKASCQITQPPQMPQCQILFNDCTPGGDQNWIDNASLFQTIDGGAAGGKGGNGGAGQRGGDGAGGPSHAVVLVGNSTFDGGVDTQLTWKQGGGGGLGRSGRSEDVGRY